MTELDKLKEFTICCVDELRDKEIRMPFRKKAPSLELLVSGCTGRPELGRKCQYSFCRNSFIPLCFFNC